MLIDEEDHDPNVAAAVRHEYFRQLNRVDSNKANPQLDIACAKAAVICEKIECDPAIYVAAQIKAWSPSNSSDRFFPNHLATKYAEDNVQKYRSIVFRGNSWKGSWDMQKHYLGLAIRNTNRTLEEILLDSTIDFDAWFRCLVSKEPIPSVLKKWGYAAGQQLKDPELKNFLDNLAVLEKVRFDLKRIPEYRPL